MEELLKQIITRLDRMEEGQKELTSEVKSLKEKMSSEVKSLREEMRSEFNNLKEADSAILGLIEKTYKKAEQIDTVADDINFLLQRNAKHDNEIREIRKAL